MTDIAPSRNLIQEEETAFRAAVSEATMTRIGALNNFHAKFQHNIHSWHLNGFYSFAQLGNGADGIFPILFNMTVVGFSYYNNLTGTSGTTTIDVHKLTGGGTDAGTIFSVKPSVTTTAANDTYTIYDQDAATTLQLPTGHTLAVLSETDFDAGEALRLDIDSAMIGANNFQFSLMYRPRD